VLVAHRPSRGGGLVSECAIPPPISLQRSSLDGSLDAQSQNDCFQRRPFKALTFPSAAQSRYPNPSPLTHISQWPQDPLPAPSARPPGIWPLLLLCRNALSSQLSMLRGLVPLLPPGLLSAPSSSRPVV
jgi:hypothetical protein